MKNNNVLGKNRTFKILNYNFVICNQLNENLDYKYVVDIYDKEKRYYRTIAYAYTIEGSKIVALKYLANVL